MTRIELIVVFFVLMLTVGIIFITVFSGQVNVNVNNCDFYKYVPLKDVPAGCVGQFMK